MTPLAALVLATPIYGFALAPPSAALAPVATAPGLAAPAVAGLHTGLPPLQVEGEEDEADDGEAEEAEAGGGGADIGMEQYAAMMRQRADIKQIHKPLGIATWASMLVTLTLGFIQWHNLYGPFQSLEESPCTSGNGIIFGEGQCTGTPWVHLSFAMLTTALYTATFSLSLMMPDPDGLDEGDSEYASNLRTHKILRWVHFAGMLAQLGLGIVIANSEAFGIDRANDYDTLQALSAVHMGIGLVTFGAMTWAGAMFLF